MNDNTGKGPDTHTQDMYKPTCTEYQQRALLSLPTNNLACIPPEED